jgi:hypothetical protein
MDRHPASDPVPLTVGLNGPWQAVSDEFDRRTKERFPIGTPVEQMGAELDRQGFVRKDWGTSLDEEHQAVRREDNFVCAVAAHVYWRADQAAGRPSRPGTIRRLSYDRRLPRPGACRVLVWVCQERPGQYQPDELQTLRLIGANWLAAEDELLALAMDDGDLQEIDDDNEDA